MLEAGKKEALTLDADVKAIETKIKAAKKSEMLKHKDAIVDLIEKEVAGRYYYQNGKIQIGLRNDEEIKEAVSVLRDESKYKKMLGKG